MVPTAIEEDVAHLELDTVLLVVDTMHLTRGLGIVKRCEWSNISEKC